MPPILELGIKNRRRHFWGPNVQDFWGNEIKKQLCPSFLTFDDTISITFDSSCRIGDHGEDYPLRFDSTVYRIDGTVPVMDGDT